MGLLDDIQQEAVDSKSDLGTLLRKCKVLASRLGSKPLEDWLLWELNGYPEDADVPAYRVWSLTVKGNFAGGLGATLSGVLVPTPLLPERVRDEYVHFKYRGSIASAQAAIQMNTSGLIAIDTGDLPMVLGTKVYQGFNCLQSWAELPVGALIELTNTVRNRVLDFALAIEKEAPHAGERDGAAVESIEASRVTQIFNTNILSSNVTIIGNAIRSSFQAISAGDSAALGALLDQNGYPPEALEELDAALKAEPVLPAGGGFGPRVTAWLGKAGAGVWQIGSAVATDLLTRALSRYYGL